MVDAYTKSSKSLARRCRIKAEDLENENYHGEAALFYEIAEGIEDGKLILDGNASIKLIEYLLNRNWQ